MWTNINALHGNSLKYITLRLNNKRCIFHKWSKYTIFSLRDTYPYDLGDKKIKSCLKCGLIKEYIWI